MIELLVAITIIVVALVVLMQLYSFFIRTSGQNKKNLEATALAQEALEAARSVRDENWTNFASLSAEAAYHPAQTGPPAKWSLTAGQETINGFTRQIVLSRVYRDANDDIVSSGGVEDSGTRKLTATVSWSDRERNYSVNLVNYLTDWR